MKATLAGKPDGAEINHDLLLCERNGFFVLFTVTFAKQDWIKYSRSYTDVAHFIGWPPEKNKLP